jgi:hypothetical protein
VLDSGHFGTVSFGTRLQFAFVGDRFFPSLTTPSLLPLTLPPQVKLVKRKSDAQVFAMKVLDKTASLRDQVRSWPRTSLWLALPSPRQFSEPFSASSQAKYQEERNIMAMSDSQWITRA